MDVKDEYLSAGGNPISTTLEQVQSLSTRVLTYPNAPFCCICRFGVKRQFIQCGITYYALYSATSS